MPTTNNFGDAVVFIVDDDVSVRKSLVRLMRSAGLKSEDYGSAEDFLARANLLQAGCILLDITMPHLTGLQLQAKLKNLQIELPVIAVSARDDADTRRMAQQLGARFFMRKPADDQALLDAIQWVLSSQP